MKRILLLGSGELGKELTISLQRFGCYIIACDKYKNAPAMQVSQEYEVFDMLNPNNLKKVIDKHEPDLIVPINLPSTGEKLSIFSPEPNQLFPVEHPLIDPFNSYLFNN